jgi:hypothetical protein
MAACILVQVLEQEEVEQEDEDDVLLGTEFVEDEGEEDEEEEVRCLVLLCSSFGSCVIMLTLSYITGGRR